MQLQFDLVTHLSHTDHSGAAYPAQTQSWPRISYGRTHTDTHTHALLRHSPLVWPITTSQLSLLSCHISHDVRALLCVTGWRLCASCVCGRYIVGDCCSVSNRELWSKWSVEHLHLSCNCIVNMCNVCVTEASSTSTDSDTELMLVCVWFMYKFNPLLPLPSGLRPPWWNCHNKAWPVKKQVARRRFSHIVCISALWVKSISVVWHCWAHDEELKIGSRIMFLTLKPVAYNTHHECQ